MRKHLLDPRAVHRGQRTDLSRIQSLARQVEALSERVAALEAGTTAAPYEPFAVKHRGRGKWDVIDSEGNRVSPKPLPKAEAEALAAGMQ